MSFNAKAFTCCEGVAFGVWLNCGNIGTLIADRWLGFILALLCGLLSLFPDD